MQLTTKKGSKYTDDLGSFGNWGERSTAGFWVEKSALETSFGGEDDASTFEVEPCSYAMFDDWVRGPHHCKKHSASLPVARMPRNVQLGNESAARAQMLLFQMGRSRQNRCGMRMNDSFDWAATATAFQLAGCC